MHDERMIFASVDEEDGTTLEPSVRKFREHIENDATLMQLFERAFAEIPQEFQQKPDGHGFPRIRNYVAMIEAVDRAVKMAPPWNSASKKDCVWLMNTRSGFEIFLRKDVNAHFTEILSAWATFLSSEASLSVISKKPKGWLSTEAIDELLCEVNGAHNITEKASTFEDAFECQPTKPSYGFKSWDDFFTRRFRPSMRPVANPADHRIVVNPCESQPLAVAINITARSEFLLKGTTYSILDMLDHDSHAERFVGGTLYQGWLSVFNYHRWHAPVSGRVLRVLRIRGTYFAAHPSKGFDNIGKVTGKPYPDGQAPDKSQELISSIATRTVILIESDLQKPGLVGFVAIGMSEVSSCIPTVSTGDYVHKGQDIGSFHYGGSSYCLLFESGVNVEFSPLVNTSHGHQPEISGRCIAINSELAKCS